MHALDFPVCICRLTPPVATDDRGPGEEVVGIDVIGVGMGIYEEVYGLIGHTADFGEQTPRHLGIAQTVYNDHITVADDDAGAAVPDQRRLKKGVNVSSQLSKFSHSSSPFPRLIYGFLTK